MQYVASPGPTGRPSASLEPVATGSFRRDAVILALLKEASQEFEAGEFTATAL